MILCCDFETSSQHMYEEEGEARVYLWASKEIYNKRHTTTHYKNMAYGISIKSYFDYLFSIKEDCTIYFHNLSHDGEFIIWELLRQKYRYNGESDKLYNHQFYSLITDDNKYYTIIIKNQGREYEFHCSYRLLPLSIAELGKIVGVEKLGDTYDYESTRSYKMARQVPEKDLMYIHNDVEIMRLILLQAFGMGIDKLTLASSAYYHWKTSQITFEREELVSLPDDIQEYVNLSYKGGITQVNPKYQGKIVEDCCSYDVNSLYPSVMLANSMPYGLPEYVEESDMIPNKYKYLIFIAATDVEIRKGYIPFVGIREGFGFNSYQYPEVLLNVELCLWYDEYELFKKYYKGNYTIGKILQFKQRAKVFDKYFEKWKTIKETTKNPAEKKIAKLMMNSLYGKFGSTKDKRSKIFDKIEGDKLHSRIEEHEVKEFYRPIASFITSCARCVLIRAMEDCHERFIYCDTDSIYLTGDRQPNIPVHESRLGYWGYEGRIQRFKALKAKCYVKETSGGVETRIAGLPKTAQRDYISIDTLEEHLKIEKAKLARKRVKGGVILCETDFTIKL